jgi:hypothetical protein
MEQPFSRWNGWRVVGLGLSFLLGCYFIAWGRTQTFGFTWRSLLADILAVFIFVAPLASISVIGLPWHIFRRSFLVVGVSAILLAEAHSIAQERLILRRYGEAPTDAVFIQRWPPFRDHQIQFVPGYGWMADD